MKGRESWVRKLDQRNPRTWFCPVHSQKFREIERESGSHAGLTLALSRDERRGLEGRRDRENWDSCPDDIRIDPCRSRGIGQILQYF